MQNKRFLIMQGRVEKTKHTWMLENRQVVCICVLYVRSLCVHIWEEGRERCCVPSSISVYSLKAKSLYLSLDSKLTDFIYYFLFIYWLIYFARLAGQQVPVLDLFRPSDPWWSTGVMVISGQAWLLYGCWGFKPRSSWLGSKCFYPLSTESPFLP